MDLAISRTACCVCSAAVPLVGGALQLAKGFGQKKAEGDGRRKLRKMRNQLVGCVTCSGTGFLPCPMCKGTKIMTGFMGGDVKCVPCNGTGTLGRKCKDCGGMGFLTT